MRPALSRAPERAIPLRVKARLLAVAVLSAPNLLGPTTPTCAPPIPVEAGHVCGDVACPATSGQVVRCNAENYCEYSRAGGEDWQRWDVTIWIPPSSFPMGAPRGEGESIEQPMHDVTFAAGFWIDRYEVTAAAFAAFLNARGKNECDGGSCAVASSPCTVSCTVTWDEVAGYAAPALTCQDEPGGPPDRDCAAHPATYVRREGAAAFCEWAGKRLCSEAEWERAAKGTAHRRFPWGDECPRSFPFFPAGTCVGEPWTPETARANCDEPDCADGFLRSSPVGQFPRGRSAVGCDDMAGNATEWVADCWHCTYVGAPTDGSAWTTDCRGPAPSCPTGEPLRWSRVARGSSWNFPAILFQTFSRELAPTLHEDRSFRCCRSPE